MSLAFIWPFVASFIRQALMAGGAYLVTKGLVDQANVTALVGALMSILSSAFSFKNAAAVVKSNVKGFGN